jgi:DNA-binding MarR family transcriptional regulator
MTEKLQHYIDKAEMEQLHYFAHLLYLENLDYGEEKKYDKRVTRRRISEDEKMEMLRLNREDGLTAAEIGGRFKLHEGTVGRVIREMKRKLGIKVSRNGKYV